MVATNVDNLEAPVTLVADLAINLITKQVDFSHSIPIESDLANTTKVRENMQQLLSIIIGFFEVETQKVESGILKEEDQLFNPYVQEINPSTKHHTRSLPAQFKRLRA